MPEYDVEFATRYIKRVFEKGVGRSVVKVLTEIVTNVDDSYVALEQGEGSEVRSRPGFGSIVIEFDRQRRTFAIVDQAEGLTDEEMKEHFTTYGEESSGRDRAKTRGLFGKGLRDVLFTQSNGQVKSIKDGKAYVSKFRWRDQDGKDRPYIDIRSGPAVTRDLRKSWRVQGNGTRVEFKLRDDIPNPQFDKLAEKLENFYMLRLITSSPNREVELQHVRGSQVQETRSVRYVPPVAASSAEHGGRDWTWVLPEGSVAVTGHLLAFEDDLVQGEVGYDDREGGLLVFDENDAVLDLTLFAYDVDPAAARFFGTLRLDGIGRIIRSRLNSSTPEEILTETRDGFDRKNSTYQELKRAADEWLNPFVEAERKRRAGGAEGLSTRTRKRHEEAFQRINSLYKRLLGDPSGSGVGTTHIRHLSTDKPLEFRWPTLLLRTGQSYSTHLLVNTTLIQPDELIHVQTADSSIAHAIDTDVPTPPRTTENETVVVGVKLEAVSSGETILTAICGEHTASMTVAVADEDVPDLTGGVAFYPDTVAAPDGERVRLKLFADLRQTGGTEASSVTSDNSNIEASLNDQWEPVTAHIVRAAVFIIGRGKGEEGFVTARVEAVEAMAAVQVVAKKTRPREGGRFRGYKFQEIENRKVQAITDSEGYIIVNLLDPTNRQFFGRSSEEASARVEESPASQMLLADLVLGECLQQAVQEAYTRGKLAQRLDEVTDIQNYIAEQRFEIGAEIHKLFVTTSPKRAAR